MWNKELTKLLLVKYQEHEHLYNVLHPDYLNRIKRSSALYKICEGLSGRNENITVEDIKKKMHTLRSQYIKELRQVTHSKRSGAEEVYEPKLWCYRQMSFLKPYCVTRTSSPSTRCGDNSLAMNMDVNSNDESMDEKPESSRNRYQQDEDAPRKKKKPTDSADDFLIMAAKKMMEPPDENLQKSEVWAAKFRKLSPIQQIYAEKFISDILFEGHLENLSRNSVIINSQRSKHCINPKELNR